MVVRVSYYCRLYLSSESPHGMFHVCVFVEPTIEPPHLAELVHIHRT